MHLVVFLGLVFLSPGVTTWGRRNSHGLRKRGEEKSRDVMGPAQSNGFAFDLYRVLASADLSKNIFFSPLSVSMSLAMLSLGARSHTKTQILHGLGFQLQEAQERELHRAFQKQLQELDLPSDNFQLSLGNALFTDTTMNIQDAFLRAVKSLYLADIFPSDFKNDQAAKKQINDYVANQTNGNIVDLIKRLDKKTIMVMVNYIFFKAKWKTSFNPEKTRQKDFHVSTKKVIQVPMMNKEDFYLFLQDSKLDCTVVGIPYQGNATALFVLPNKDSMKQVESGLNAKTLQKWLEMLRRRKFEIYLPRFSIEGSYELKNDLPKLGIREIFTSQADLSGITSLPNIYVSEIVHKSMVEVDELGTTASAATEIGVSFRSAWRHTPVIILDRPFLILIVHDRTNSILFLGKVNYP
ncbi:PREDICTED: plasma serine protease inhibitor [Elephantulus edwardii]|uniref:plasma serine protease inhibitor n=1 Tax=Elephantulus edwardii TaxID=28737 RepID=UPI0003F0836C|nr:PREDICTED: plasma serine protease inhibitor [Elephantulus edwardii]